jgi:hypothetical protein
MSEHVACKSVWDYVKDDTSSQCGVRTYEVGFVESLIGIRLEKLRRTVQIQQLPCVFFGIQLRRETGTDRKSKRLFGQVSGTRRRINLTLWRTCWLRV